jgi:hypothetical protein
MLPNCATNAGGQLGSRFIVTRRHRNALLLHQTQQLLLQLRKSRPLHRSASQALLYQLLQLLHNNPIYNTSTNPRHYVVHKQPISSHFHAFEKPARISGCRVTERRAEVADDGPRVVVKHYVVRVDVSVCDAEAVQVREGAGNAVADAQRSS